MSSRAGEGARAATGADGGVLFGGVEMGGTHVVCAVGTAPDDLRARVSLETTDPPATLAAIAAALAPHAPALTAIGVASFGPLVLDRHSPAYGHIDTTPKAGWSGTDVIGSLRAAIGVPVGFDTDVNGAALAETRWGAARGVGQFAYITAGTGIGGGGIVGGVPMHGRSHPEMGHIRIPRHPDDPLMRGTCPFHPDCWEGWAAKAAIERRWGVGTRASDLIAAEDLGLLAHYLGAGVANVICTLSPERVVLGGGIVLGGGDAGHRERLLRLVRAEVGAALGGYLPAYDEPGMLDTHIVAAALGADAGVLGAILLAAREAAAD